MYWNIWTWYCSFFISTQISVASLFKKDLELLTDEKGITGGICHAIHRYAKVSNKYTKIYDKNK